MIDTLNKAGDYLVECLEQRLERASNRTPVLAIRFKALGKYDEAGTLKSCPAFEGVSGHSLKSEASLRHLRADLRGIIDLVDLSVLTHDAPRNVGLVGKRLTMRCTLEPFEGRMVERWGIRRNEPLTRDEIGRLQELYGNLLGNSKAPSASSDDGSERHIPGQVTAPALAAEPVAA